jgi:hypothetical protein
MTTRDKLIINERKKSIKFPDTLLPEDAFNLVNTMVTTTHPAPTDDKLKLSDDNENKRHYAFK